jgi:hypothetical protein
MKVIFVLEITPTSHVQVDLDLEPGDLLETPKRFRARLTQRLCEILVEAGVYATEHEETLVEDGHYMVLPKGRDLLG